MNTISLIVLLMIVSTVVTDQVQARQRPKSEESGVYSNLSLGFRCAPPSAMRDESEQLRSRIQEQEKGSGTAHGHAVL